MCSTNLDDDSVKSFADMGTKLEAAIDLLATKSFVAATSEVRDSMERAFEQQSIDAVKKTMLKQEEVFKQQVRELHRLYSVQRMLMDEMKNENRHQSKYPRTTTSSPTQGTAGFGYNFRVQSEKDECTWELSRSSSSDTKAGIAFDIIRPAEGNAIGTGIRAIDAAAGPSSSCSTIMPAGSSRFSGASHAGSEDDLCGVDLTLSIGGGVGGSKKRLKELQPYQSVGLESSEATESDQKSREQEPRQEKRQPWSL